MSKKKGKGKKGSKDRPKENGKKNVLPPSPTGRTGSPAKFMPAAAPPPPHPPMAGPPQPSVNVADQVQQTSALKELMDKKMLIWNHILAAAKDVDRKEGLKEYRSIAEEELRIIARNISKTKLHELIDEKVNYFCQVGTSNSEDKKIANMQGFRQVGEKERVLCALEAPEVAHRVFPDVPLDEALPVKLNAPPSTLPPGAFGGQAGPVQRQEPFTTLVKDTTVLDGIADQMTTLDKATLEASRKERATPYGGVMTPGMQSPLLPLSPAMERQRAREQQRRDQAELMEQAQMMSARLPKRRLPPVGHTPQVEQKSRLVSQFTEKLAEEIAANRISKAEALNQLRDIVEMENELTETLLSVTTVKPDLTEEKLQAIAGMYKEISFTVISNPEMNREEALNNLKRVAAMEHELTQALVSNEEIQGRQQQSAEDSMFKLQQMKLNLTDELHKNMAASQPDANRVQQIIRELYELQLKLMDKLLAAKSDRDRGRERDRRHDRNDDEKDGRRVYWSSRTRPTTTVELSFGASSGDDDYNNVPVIQMKLPEFGRSGEEKTGKICPVHGDKTMPGPLHLKIRKKDASCPVHSERLATSVSWSFLLPGGGTSASTAPHDRTTLERTGDYDKESKRLDKGQREQGPRTQPPPSFHPYPCHPPGYTYSPPHMIPLSPGPWAPPMYPPWDSPGMPTGPYTEQPRQPQELGRNQQIVYRRPAGGAEFEPDRPPAEPRIIIPTRYKGMQQDTVRNEDKHPHFGDVAYYDRQASWDVTAQEMHQRYMTQEFPQMYPVMPIREPVFYSSAQVTGYRRTPNVDAAVDTAHPVTESDTVGEESGLIHFETGVEINVSPSGTQVVPITRLTGVQEVQASIEAPLPAPLPLQPESTSLPVVRRQQPPRRQRPSRRASERSRERDFNTYTEDNELGDDEAFQYRRPKRSPRRRRGRRAPSWRSGFDDDSERPPQRSRRKRRSRSSRRSCTDSSAEEVPPGVPFWDWICKSICNLLPFSRDGNGKKSRRGATIQELVNEVMATSEEVVQAKRELQSNNGDQEASVRSMGDLEGKLWKLIDLEVDLVNELARYRWSGDVQDPRAEIKLNDAEEKIWKVIGVQTRLAQDLGDWIKNSTRSFQSRAPERQPYGGPINRGNLRNYGDAGGYGNPKNYSPANDDGIYGDPSGRGNTKSYVNPGIQDGPGNPVIQDPSASEESTRKLKKKSSKVSNPSKASNASKKPKRSERASRKKQRNQPNNVSNDGSPAQATPGKKPKSRKSSKKRNKSRGLSPDTTTSNTTTNTSARSSDVTSSEISSETTDVTSTVVSEVDSVTVTNTFVISSEMNDAEDNAKPSAISWKSPSKEFLSSIDRSQTTPVEWETKRKGKYVYVRPRQAGTGRKPARSASHSPPRTAKSRAHQGPRRHSAGPRDSIELYHRGHAADRRDSSPYRMGRRQGPHRRPERPRSHIYASVPEHSRHHDRHRHSAHRHRTHAHCDPYAQRHRRIHQGVDDGNPIISASISWTSEITVDGHNNRVPREFHGASNHRGNRGRRYRSMGPHSSRSVRYSRSQWSV